MLREELIQLTTEDQEEIALCKIYIPEDLNNKHIFLTHGTFSDKRICLGVAQFLATKGYTCWIMEWRNHGSSGPTIKKFNLETVALLDIAAVFDYLANYLQEKIALTTEGIILIQFSFKRLLPYEIYTHQHQLSTPYIRKFCPRQTSESRKKAQEIPQKVFRLGSYP